jgi:hypothetical protein
MCHLMVLISKLYLSSVTIQEIAKNEPGTHTTSSGTSASSIV